MTGALGVRALTDDMRPWARSYLIEHWGSDLQVAHGEAFRPHEHDGFVATLDGTPAGLLTCRQDHSGSLEVTSLTAAPQRRGLGTALLAEAVRAARKAGCERLWLITTNDNVDALRFYQRRGMRLAALRPGAVDAARRLKREIPAVGRYAIPIRDEIELELRLEQATAQAPPSAS